MNTAPKTNLSDGNSISKDNSLASPTSAAKRLQDVATLQKIFQNLNTNALDIYYFEEARQGSGRMHEVVMFFVTSLEYVVRPVTFHIHDQRLSEKFWRFYNAWMTSIAQFNTYSQRTELFWSVFRIDDIDGHGKAFEEYLRQVYETEIACKEFIKHVKENFTEIDISQTDQISQKSWEKYREEIERER